VLVTWRERALRQRPVNQAPVPRLRLLKKAYTTALLLPGQVLTVPRRRPPPMELRRPVPMDSPQPRALIRRLLRAIRPVAPHRHGRHQPRAPRRVGRPRQGRARRLAIPLRTRAPPAVALSHRLPIAGTRPTAVRPRPRMATPARPLARLIQPPRRRRLLVRVRTRDRLIRRPPRLRPRPRRVLRTALAARRTMCPLRKAAVCRADTGQPVLAFILPGMTRRIPRHRVRRCLRHQRPTRWALACPPIRR
jgi:hypothetical protein